MFIAAAMKESQAICLVQDCQADIVVFQGGEDLRAYCKVYTKIPELVKRLAEKMTYDDHVILNGEIHYFFVWDTAGRVIIQLSHLFDETE